MRSITQTDRDRGAWVQRRASILSWAEFAHHDEDGRYVGIVTRVNVHGAADWSFTTRAEA